MILLSDKIKVMLGFLPLEKREDMNKCVKMFFVDELKREGCEIRSETEDSVEWELNISHPLFPDSARMYREDVLFPDNMPDEVILEYVGSKKKFEEELLSNAFMSFFKKEGVI